MAIVYKCRHCRQEIGRLDEQKVSMSMLGLDELSSADKRDMLNYGEDGDTEVIAICEDCEASLGRYPHYHELSYFIQ